MGAKFDKTTVAESQIHAVDGRTLVDIAADTGAEPFDVLLDLALAEDLHTRFLVVIANDDDVELADLLLDHRAMLGLSDAGAHAEQLCDANFSTHLLGVWCREKGVLTLEDAVWRLTGQPAEVFGLAERGRIAPGFHADLVAFDPATVGSEPLERVRDLPGGADRLIAHSIGIEHVWVNGTAIRRDGKDIPDARPGQLLTAG
jgi:N-acyl-D-aspartate/D-glutamate deacylase